MTPLTRKITMIPQNQLPLTTAGWRMITPILNTLQLFWKRIFNLNNTLKKSLLIKPDKGKKKCSVLLDLSDCLLQNLSLFSEFNSKLVMKHKMIWRKHEISVNKTCLLLDELQFIVIWKCFQMLNLLCIFFCVCVCVWILDPVSLFMWKSPILRLLRPVFLMHYLHQFVSHVSWL